MTKQFGGIQILTVWNLWNWDEIGSQWCEYGHTLRKKPLLSPAKSTEKQSEGDIESGRGLR